VPSSAWETQLIAGLCLPNMFDVSLNGGRGGGPQEVPFQGRAWERGVLRDAQAGAEFYPGPKFESYAFLESEIGRTSIGTWPPYRDAFAVGIFRFLLVSLMAFVLDGTTRLLA